MKASTFTTPFGGIGWRAGRGCKEETLCEAGYNPETHAPVGENQKVVIALSDGQVKEGEYVAVQRFNQRKGKLAPSAAYAFSHFKNLAEFASFSNSIPVTRIKGGRSFYELILQNTPLRVAFDLEYEPHDPEHMPVGHRLLGDSIDKGEFLRAVFVDRVLPFVSHLAGRIVTATEFACLDASNDRKLSFHLASTNLFIPADSRTAWVAALREALSDLKPLVDLGVYNSRPMRLPLCAKPGTGRYLVPALEVGGVHFADTPQAQPGDLVTVELLLAHMWTQVPRGAEPLAGLTAAAPPRTKAPTVKQLVSFRGGVVTREAFDALAPYIVRAGFTKPCALVETFTKQSAYFFNFHSDQVCPFCQERPHLNAGYSIKVYYHAGSEFGSVYITPWSAGCKPETGKRCYNDSTPLPLATLAASKEPGLAPPPPPPNIPDEAGPDQVQPSPELEAQLKKVLALSVDETMHYRIQAGVLTVHLSRSPWVHMLATSQVAGRVLQVFVEGGKARVVCCGFLLASFPEAFVPTQLQSARLSGVPFLEWGCFEPTLRRALGDGVTLSALDWLYDQYTYPHGTSLAFWAKVPGTPKAVCAVVNGQLLLRHPLRRHPDWIEDVWVPLDDYDPEALAPLTAAFSAVYSELLERHDAQRHDDGRITVKSLKLEQVWPWTASSTLALGGPPPEGGDDPSTAQPAPESAEALRARLNVIIEARRLKAAAEDDNIRRREAEEDEENDMRLRWAAEEAEAAKPKAGTKRQRLVTSYI